MAAKLALSFSTLGLLGCTTVPAAAPRPASLLPAEVAARYGKPRDPPSAVVLETWDYEGCRWEGGDFAAGDGIELPFELFLPKEAGRTPFVLVLPYLDGSYLLPRLLCKALAEKGIAAGFLQRPGEILAPSQRAQDLERLVRRGVSRYRAFLDWAGSREEVDPRRLGLVGVSMGAMVGTVLLAADPRLSRAVLILPGCDLSGLLLESGEEKIVDYLAARTRNEDVTREQIREEFRRDFASDPALLAPYLGSEGLLMVSARYDGVIPRPYSDRLWELLGRPERILLPTGHGTSGLCLPYVSSRMVRHFQGWPGEGGAGAHRTASKSR